MIEFCSCGGGKNRKIMGKQRIFRRTGFMEKHTNSEGKKLEIRHTREDFITFFNTFNRKLIKME